MTTLSVVGLLVLSAIGAGSLFFIVFCDKPASVLKSLVKTLSIAALAGAAWTASAPFPLTLALAFSAMGDLALSRNGDKAFLTGMVAFGAAHFAYIALMAPAGLDLSVTSPVIALASVAAIAGAVFFYNAGWLRWAVLAYVLVITAMGLAALSLPPNVVLGQVAAGLFIISDLMIGFERFVFHHRNPILKATPYLIWGSYFAAQLLFLFAFSLMWIT